MAPPPLPPPPPPTPPSALPLRWRPADHFHALLNRSVDTAPMKKHSTDHSIDPSVKTSHSHSIAIRYLVHVPQKRHLFFEQNDSPNNPEQKIQRRSLRVRQLPPNYTAYDVRNVYGVFGKIEKVFFERDTSKKTPLKDVDEENDVDMTVAEIVEATNTPAAAASGSSSSSHGHRNTLQHTSTACILFEDANSVERATSKEISKTIMPYHAGSARMGLEKYKHYYKEERPDVEAMNEQTAEAKKREARKAAKRNEMSKFVTMYKHQNKEAKRARIVALRERFEADKERVEAMKAKRKFKPHG